MLHCTACRSALSPFAQHRPVVEKTCPHCAARLRVHRRGGREQEVEGPVLPPVPPGVTVEGEVPRPGAYREAPRAGTFRLRWKDQVGYNDDGLLMFAGAMTVGGLLGALVHPASLLFSAYGTGLTMMVAWTRPGELALDSSELRFRIGRGRHRRTLPREAIEGVRIVDEVDPQGAPSRFRVLVSSGGSWTLVAHPRSGAVARYVAASLRVSLWLDDE